MELLVDLKAEVQALQKVSEDQKKALKALLEQVDKIKAAQASLQGVIDRLTAVRNANEKVREEQQKTQLLQKSGLPRLPKVWSLPTIVGKPLVSFDFPEAGGGLKLTTFTRAVEKNYASALEDKAAIAEYKNRELATPQDVTDALARITSKVFEGDIIDIGDYRGIGYYYVFKNPKTKSLYVRQTFEEYGYYLPEEALPILKKLGIETWDQVEKIWPNILGIEINGKPYDFLGFDDDQSEDQLFRLSKF